MVLAVLERRGRVGLGQRDVYAATVGGVRLGEPAADLAVALAVAGATGDLALPQGAVAFGEVGLAGEVRPVPGVERRLAEAARLGFTLAMVPPGPVAGARRPAAARARPMSPPRWPLLRDLAAAARPDGAAAGDR